MLLMTILPSCVNWQGMATVGKKCSTRIWMRRHASNDLLRDVGGIMPEPCLASLLMSAGNGRYVYRMGAEYPSGFILLNTCPNSADSWAPFTSVGSLPTTCVIVLGASPDNRDSRQETTRRVCSYR